MRVRAMGMFVPLAIWVAVIVPACAAREQEKCMMTRVQEHGPLQQAEVMAFAVTRDSEACRRFYEGKLGLRLIADEPTALVLASGGTVIRFQKMPDHQPEKFTVLGWKVPDIRATAARLAAADVKIERFAWMTFQDASGIATFPNGDRVAWFKDPDGNVLSIAQLQ
jgi:catechol 2,3-dioxygenase-like lactoylglutathione lyase family enzyme